MHPMPSPSDDARTPMRVRVASYNLYLGADLRVMFAVQSPADMERAAAVVHQQVLATDFPARAELIASLLVREQVDVVGLQEVARWKRIVEGVGGGEQAEVWLDFLDLLVAALCRAGEHYDVHAHTPSFHGVSRVPGGEQLAVTGHNAVLVRGASGLRVTGESTGRYRHTLAIPTGMPDAVVHVARSWGWVDTEVGGRPVRFVNTHTEAWNAEIRDAQRDELLAAIGEPGFPVVVLGDLNATPDRVGMPEEYVDAWSAAGDGGPGATCGQAADLANAESSLVSRIDYVFVRGAAVTGCRVVGGEPGDRTAGGLWPSDHAGVVADLTL